MDPAIARLCADLQNLLVHVLDDPGLNQLRTRRKPHPALDLWQTTQQFAARGQLAFEDEIATLRKLSGLALDQATWFTSEAGRGTSSTVDKEAWRQIRRRASDQSAFADTLAELYTWGQLSQRMKVSLSQAESRADLQFPDGAGEVKRIHYGTGLGRVKKVLTKANQQLKRSTEGFGVLFLFLEGDGHRASLDSGMPREVLPFHLEIERLITSGYFSGIDIIVLGWDEVLVFGSKHERETVITFARKSHIYRNQAGRNEDVGDTERFSMSRSVDWTLTYPGATAPREDWPTTTLGNVRFSGDYLRGAETTGIRRQHVIAALKTPDGEFHDVREDHAHIFTTRYVSLGAPHVLLIHSYHKEGKLPIVQRAYRLYGFDELEEIARHPLEALLLFLGKYGVDVIVGPLQGRLFPALTIERPASKDFTIIGVPDLPSDPPGTEYDVRCHFSLRTDVAPGLIDVEWAYAVNLTAYMETSIAARSRRGRA